MCEVEGLKLELFEDRERTSAPRHPRPWPGLALALAQVQASPGRDIEPPTLAVRPSGSETLLISSFSP